jgi:hypothetical protein
VRRDRQYGSGARRLLPDTVPGAGVGVTPDRIHRVAVPKKDCGHHVRHGHASSVRADTNKFQAGKQYHAGRRLAPARACGSRRLNTNNLLRVRRVGPHFSKKSMAKVRLTPEMANLSTYFCPYGVSN